MGRDTKQSELEGMAERSSGRSANPSGEIGYNRVNELLYGRSKKPGDYKN